MDVLMDDYIDSIYIYKQDHWQLNGFGDVERITIYDKVVEKSVSLSTAAYISIEIGNMVCGFTILFWIIQVTMTALINSWPTIVEVTFIEWNNKGPICLQEDAVDL